MNNRYSDNLEYSHNPISKRKNFGTETNIVFIKNGGRLLHVGGYSKQDILEGLIGTAAIPLLALGGYHAYKHFKKK